MCTRRNFLKTTGLVASTFVFDPARLLASTRTSANVSLQNSAISVIFIFLSGAPSQVDTWDLKEGSWTPADFEPTSYGGVRFPRGLLPKTAEHAGKLAFVRSGLAWAAVHQLGQTWAQIARNPGGATGAIAPHMGAVVSLESPAGVLPGFIALNSGGIPTSGYLPAKHAPFGMQTSSTGLATLAHPEGTARFNDRYALMQQLDPKRTHAVHDFYAQGKTLMEAPGVNDLFTFSDEERTRYGGSTFGESLIVARNIVSADRGARFVQVTLGGWDHHAAIYDREGGIYAQTSQFDPAFGALLTDLEASKRLDSTLIVVMSEFGRTVGALNNQQGRDHYLRMSIVFAGAGIRGARALGTTDAKGENVTDYGWSADRDVRPEDVACTIYSALGIDYTTVRTDDPLGRGFEYVPYAREGLYAPIDELWG
ncbi:MAG TPA: DUF1501 domain-containing protein [Thermoanaerobaculia bacterium]